MNRFDNILRFPFIRNVWRWLMTSDPDTYLLERGQTLLRVTIVSIIYLYVLIFLPTSVMGILALSLNCVLSFIVHYAVTRDKVSRIWRRVLMNAVDAGMVGFMLILNEEAGVPFFAVYLWITLGSGFRFGGAALVLSTIFSAISFSMVVLYSKYWIEHLPLTTGVYGSLIIIPLYALFLLRKIGQERTSAIAANAAKGEFLARMSHELRTPLNSITMSADILGTARNISKDDQSLLNIIHDAVAVSLRHIENLLNFSRLGAGKIALDHSELDLHAVVRATINLVRPVARKKGLILLCGIAPDTPYRLIGDQRYLQEVLINLTSNAVKFTDTGYAALSVSVRKKNNEQALVRFEVTDTGVGISPESLNLIWEGFAQEDASTSRRFGGTGLGTSIAKQLVELMGGEIGVTSEKGRGSVFWCEIPFKLASSHGADDETATINGTSIMLFTKDHEVSHRIRNIVHNIGGRCVVSETIQDGVSTIASTKRMGRAWHLALVDESCDATNSEAGKVGVFIANSTTEQIPVYLLTDIPQDARQLYARGYSGALPSDVSESALANVVRSSSYISTAPDGAAQNIYKVDPMAWGHSDRSQHKVLIADNNRTDHLIISSMLSSAGYKVDIAESGDDALDKLIAGGYSAAVLDLHMPGMSGASVIQQYHFIAAGMGVPCIPMIILSADNTFAAEHDSANAGADAFLTKPVSAERIVGTLESLIHDWILSQEKHQPLNNIVGGVVVDNESDLVLDNDTLQRLESFCRGTCRFSDIVNSFIEEGGDIVRKASDALNTGSFGAYSEHMHALRSMASSIGATRLAEISRCDTKISGMVQKNEEKRLVQVRRVYNTTCEYLRGRLATAVSSDR